MPDKMDYARSEELEKHTKRRWIVFSENDADGP